MKIKSLNRVALLLLLNLCSGLPQTTSAMSSANQAISVYAFIIDSELLVKPEFANYWNTLMATLQGVSGLVFGAGAGIYFYDFATQGNNTQPQDSALILHKVLAITGLSILAASELIRAARGFQMYRADMPLIPGSKTYHFITTGGASLGLIFISSGIGTEYIRLSNVGNFIVLLSYGVQGLTTDWKAAEGKYFRLFQTVAGTIGGICFTVANLIPSEYTNTINGLFSAALTLFFSTLVPGSIYFFNQLVRSRLVRPPTDN